MTTLLFRTTALSLAVAGLALALPALAQAPRDPDSAQATVSPPVNHESGVIQDVLTAQDAGDRFCTYLMQWRDTTAFVPCASPPHQRGDTVEFVVYRETKNGHRALRFAPSRQNADDSSERIDSAGFQATVSAGRSVIQHVLVADNDGYRGVAYEVPWHNAQVMVIDPTGASNRQVGDTINFKVIRTELNHELSFALDE